MDLAGMDLTFPTAAHILLCSALLVTAALISVIIYLEYNKIFFTEIWMMKCLCF